MTFEIERARAGPKPRAKMAPTSSPTLVRWSSIRSTDHSRGGHPWRSVRFFEETLLAWSVDHDQGQFSTCPHGETYKQDCFPTAYIFRLS